MCRITAILAIIILFSGCAAMQTVGTFLKGSLSKTETVLCNPTIPMVEDAISALTFIQAYPSVSTGLAGAIATFEAIRSKICVSISQVKAALDQFDMLVASVQETNKVAGIKAMKATMPELKTLREAVK